jgi:hypothetical protein
LLFRFQYFAWNRFDRWRRHVPFIFDKAPYLEMAKNCFSIGSAQLVDPSINEFYYDIGQTSVHKGS